MKLLCQYHNNFIESLLPNSSTPQCFSTHGLDEFKLLHLIFFFLNQKFIKLLVAHVLWEYLEITNFFKVNVSKLAILNGSTNEYNGDSFLNFLTDNLAFYVGYELEFR